MHRYYFKIACLCFLLFSYGCREAQIEPFEEETGIFSVYGALNINEDRHIIRVRDLSSFHSDSSTRNIDAVVTFHDLEAGTSQILRDSVAHFPAGFTHNFILEKNLKPRTTYKVTVEGSDGRIVSSTFTTPGITKVLALPLGTPVSCSANIQFEFENLVSTFPSDAGHDLSHIHRVVANARSIHEKEGGNWPVVFAAAWLHDCVQVPKNDPRRPQASKLSARKAHTWLTEKAYPADLSAIVHAIEAHSFSAGIDPETLEAAIVQDADRLDALGAIGLARCLRVGVEMGTQLYESNDPFCKNRQPAERLYSIDHFYTTLLHLSHSFQPEFAKHLAQQRTKFLCDYLNQLERELTGKA